MPTEVVGNTAHKEVTPVCGKGALGQGAIGGSQQGILEDDPSVGRVGMQTTVGVGCR